MRSAWSSLGCMAVAVLLIVSGRPGSDWFENGGGAWLMFGFWGAAVILALVGIGTAAFSARLSVRARLVAGSVSGMTLATTVFMTWAIMSLVSHVR